MKQLTKLIWGAISLVCIAQLKAEPPATQVDIDSWNKKIARASTAGERWATSPTMIAANIAGDIIGTDGTVGYRERKVSMEAIRSGEQQASGAIVTVTDDRSFDHTVKKESLNVELKLIDSGWQIVRANHMSHPWPTPLTLGGGLVAEYMASIDSDSQLEITYVSEAHFIKNGQRVPMSDLDFPGASISKVTGGILKDAFLLRVPVAEGRIVKVYNWAHVDGEFPDKPSNTSYSQSLMLHFENKVDARKGLNILKRLRVSDQEAPEAYVPYVPVGAWHLLEINPTGHAELEVDLELDAEYEYHRLIGELYLSRFETVFKIDCPDILSQPIQDHLTGHTQSTPDSFRFTIDEKLKEGVRGPLKTRCKISFRHLGDPPADDDGYAGKVFLYLHLDGN